MFLIIAIVLLAMWLLGFSLHFGGSLIHILLVIAVIFFLVRVIQGRNPLK